jgi:hypothetical protein
MGPSEKKASSGQGLTDNSGASVEDSRSDLAELTGQLGQVAQFLSEANRQISAYLAEQESRSAAHNEQFAGALGAEFTRLAEKLDKLTGGGGAGGGDAKSAAGPDQEAVRCWLEPLSEKLDQIEAKLGNAERGSARNAAETAGVSASQVLEAVNQQTRAVSESFRQLQDQLGSGLEQLTQLLTPDEEDSESELAPAGSAEWQRAILGPDLADNSALAFQWDQLVRGVLEGEPGACGFAGQLLVFQSAPPERLPQLLKDVGEALYRWQPKTSPGTNAMEEALVAWLHNRCEAAGIYNTIEVAHPGQRFDSARHSATSRGVEITEVHGWIVLRDNGRVYMKASVSVR